MAETQPDPRLEIAHVLFMDIVGFSKSLINEQSEVLRQLNQVVRDTAQVKAAEAAAKLIRIQPATEWLWDSLPRPTRPFVAQ